MEIKNTFYPVVLILILGWHGQLMAQEKPAEISSGINAKESQMTRDNFWQGGTDNSIYFLDGKVGIGLADPKAKLHVQGNMKLGSDIGEVGENSFAGGQNCIASGNYSFAFGREAKATHLNSVAIGFKAEAKSEMTVGIGYRVYANAESTYLFGERISAGSSGAFVIGRGASNADMIQNNVINSLMVGFNSNLPTLFIGPSGGAGATGNIGIGNMTDPQAKLHILSDENEAATLKLEHQTTGTKRYAQLFLGDHSIKAGNSIDMTFTTPSSNEHFVFENGNVAIGLTEPTAKLHVQGNMKLGSNIGNVGINAFAGGQECEASGMNSFAYGKKVKSSGLASFATGLESEATGEFSVAMGRGNIASQHAAIALGFHVEATASNTVSIGRFVRASVSNAYVIGSGSNTGSNMLVNDKYFSLMIGFKSTAPTFFVSSSEGGKTTGRIGIGNMTDPQAKLHILSDENEAATLKLEHQTTGTNRFAQLFLGDHSIKAGNDNNMVFTTPSHQKHFVFENGKVGIGVDNPTSILHVHQDDEPTFTLSNIQSSLIMAITNTPTPTSQAGDVVFKTAGNNDHRGMIFTLNDDSNDGKSYIKFNDNHNPYSLTILNNGNIGVGTAEPLARVHIEDGDIYLHDIQSGIVMKSPDGQCWRGKLNEQGSLFFSPVACPEGSELVLPKQQAAEQLRIYPNPTTGIIRIESSIQNGNIEALVYSLNGTLLLQKLLNASSDELNLEHLVAGTYIVSFKHDNKVIANEKVVKQ